MPVLHPGRPADRRSWWGCAQPGSPLDDFWHFDPRCDACLDKLEIDIERGDELLLRRGLDYWRRELAMARVNA